MATMDVQRHAEPDSVLRLLRSGPRRVARYPIAARAAPAGIPQPPAASGAKSKGTGKRAGGGVGTGSGSNSGGGSGRGGYGGGRRAAPRVRMPSASDSNRSARRHGHAGDGVAGAARRAVAGRTGRGGGSGSSTATSAASLVRRTTGTAPARGEHATSTGSGRAAASGAGGKGGAGKKVLRTAGRRVIARLVLPFMALEDLACGVARVNHSWWKSANSFPVLRELVRGTMEQFDIFVEIPRCATVVTLRDTLRDISLDHRKWNPAALKHLGRDFKISVFARFKPLSADPEETKLLKELTADMDREGGDSASGAIKLRRSGHGGAGGDGRPSTPRRRVPRRPSTPRSGGSGGGTLGFGYGASRPKSAGRDGKEEDEGPTRRRPYLLGCTPTQQTLFVPGIGPRVFNMPSAGESQHEVFRTVALPVIRKFMLGLSATIFAYGQTGSGKTHTLFGDHDLWETSGEGARSRDVGAALGGADADHLGDQLGLVPRIFAEIFASVRRDKTSVANLNLEFIEIYNDGITDLISAAPRALIHGGARRLKSGKISSSTYRLDGSGTTVHTLHQTMEFVAAGLRRRTAAATAMNARSSRSHAILIATLSQRHKDTDELKTSVLQLVDLAGSERLKKSKAEGEHFTEMIAINSSLTSLGRCITSLASKDRHVPYGDAALTKLLQPSLGGNCVTAMIVACASDNIHAEETLSSLRFGERTASVTNSVSIQRKSVESVVRETLKQIDDVQTLMRNMEVNGTAGTELYERHRLRLQTLRLQLDQMKTFAQETGAA